MDEQNQAIFEQSEVLWAKIRGYPWWPAYVTIPQSRSAKFILHKRPSIMNIQSFSLEITLSTYHIQQKVSSRLGPSKLRKFPDYYSECYAKTKTNKKLKQSIQRAEERLKQNQQDVSIYQNMRTQMKIKKKRGPMSESRLSSSDKNEGLDPPDLIKHKTHEIPRPNKRKQQKQQEELFQQQQSQSNQEQSARSAKNNNRKDSLKNNQQVRRRSQTIRNLAKSSPSKKIETPPIQQQTSAIVRSRRLLRVPRDNQQSSQPSKQKSNIKSKQKMEDQSKQKAMESQQQKEKVVYKAEAKNIRRGRKGRPPKSQQIQRQKQKHLAQQKDQEEQQVQSEKQSSKQVEPIQQLTPKRGRKRLLHNSKLLQSKNIENSNVVSNQIGTLTQKQAQKIRNSLKNRKQLTKILLQMPINAGNVKQILDLGVSLVLQEGPINKNIHLILCTLKATLLHKYFPDDNKHRRKYEKMIKQKKKVVLHQQEDENEDNNQQNGNSQCQNNNKMIDEGQEEKTQEKPNQKNKSKKVKQKQTQKQAQLENQLMKLKQIRIKANVKLQKMIKKSGLQDGAKQFAMKIQNTFQQAADSKGDLYRNIAYERMRTIKTRLAQLSEKSATPHEIQVYLQQVLHTYESQSAMHQTND